MCLVLGRYPAVQVPAPPIDPMSLSGAGHFEALLADAGFAAADVTVRQGAYPFDLGADDDAAFKMGVLPVLPALNTLAAADPTTMPTAKAAFYAHVQENHWQDAEGRVVFPGNQFKLAIAVKSK